MRKEFLKNLKTTLELIVVKEAYAQITFSQYALHKFFEALNSFVDEMQIQLNELIVVKEAYAQITFSQYALHKFFEALNSFVDEMQIQLNDLIHS